MAHGIGGKEVISICASKQMEAGPTGPNGVGINAFMLTRGYGRDSIPDSEMVIKAALT